MKMLYIPLALAAIFAATPASAQFSGFNKPRFGTGSVANTPSPATAIGSLEGARINRIRSEVGANQHRPVKICDTDIAFGTQDARTPQLTSRRKDTYVGNIEVYSGGFGAGCNRRQQ